MNFNSLLRVPLESLIDALASSNNLIFLFRSNLSMSVCVVTVSSIELFNFLITCDLNNLQKIVDKYSNKKLLIATDSNAHHEF